MLEVLKKYSGVLLFYLVIVGIVLFINTTPNRVNNQTDIITYAISE